MNFWKENKFSIILFITGFISAIGYMILATKIGETGITNCFLPAVGILTIGIIFGNLIDSVRNDNISFSNTGNTHNAYE